MPTQARVARVIDGDTIEIADGRLVRYLGIDAPELRRRVGGRWVEQPDPFGREATALNRRLVEGRTVRLEYDVRTHDRYGRLLAHVYVGSESVNATLLKEGAARVRIIPPNVRYADEFRRFAAEARRQRRGLWSSVAQETPYGD